MEDWLVNRLNGAIFEFAFDPTLEKSSEGLSVAPMKRGLPLPEDKKE
jgi:hypothetical protein